MAQIDTLVLASGSPRRHKLMQLLQIPFEIRVPTVDESALLSESPAALPQRISRLKAEFVALQMEGGIVIAADTVVVYKGSILGKPQYRSHARAMLRKLRSDHHRVLTGITVMESSTGKHVTELCDTKVWLRAMDEDEIDDYIASGDPMDKAAAYAIQNAKFQPVARLIGCSANVMGLPLCHVVRNLRRFGLVLPDGPATRCETRYEYRCALTKHVMPYADGHFA